MVWQVVRLVVVIVLLALAAVMATPRNRLPLALRGLNRVLGRPRADENGERVPLKRRLLALLALIGAILAAITASAAEPVRFPFGIVAGKGAEAVDASVFLDAPAGKYGFVRVDGGGFKAGDRAIVFNGTGFTASACFPEHADAELLADSVARFGFNCLRLHFIDAWYRHHPSVPQGVFAFPRDNWRTLDPAQLDRLDYLVAALKRRGVYVDLNLHVGRRFGPELGFPPDPSPDGKYHLPLVPRMGELMREYARDLLTHVNPYTGNAYADEPAMALLEISNENSFDEAWERLGRFRKGEWYYNDEYLALLKARWNDWRREHLGADDEVELPERASADLKTVRFFRLFLDDLERRFYLGMRDYLRGELGVKCPIAGTQVSFAPARIQAELDYLDGHCYWHHPRVGSDGVSTVVNESMVGTLRGMFELGVFARRELPFTVSEYNHPHPTDFAPEAMPILVSWGLKEGWDGMFLYCWTHNPKPSDSAMIDNNFDLDKRSDVLVHLPATAALALRDRAAVGEQAVRWTGRGTSRAGYQVDTPQVKIFTGYTPTNVIEFAGGVGLRLYPTSIDHATVSVLARTATGFAASGRLIVAASATARNDGERFEELPGKRRHILDWGHAPLLAEGVAFDLTLPVAAPRIRAWALGPDGRRRAEVRAAPAGEAARLEFRPEYATLWYEVEIR